MARYGYIRKRQGVSLMGQMNSLFPYNYQQLFIEKEDIGDTKELERCLSLLDSEDTLVVDRLSSFGQPLGSEIMNRLSHMMTHQNVRLICLEESLDTKKEPLFIELMSVVNESERHVFEKRHEKLSKNKAKIGRPHIKEEVSEQIWQLYVQKKTLREIAAICHVSVGTVHRYVKKQKNLNSINE